MPDLLDNPKVVEALLTNNEKEAIASFWEFRVYMNPKLTLRGLRERDCWFPRNVAWRLRTFWDELKAGNFSGLSPTPVQRFRGHHP